MASDCRQNTWIDADFGHGAMPFGLILLIENQRLVGGYNEPPIFLNFTVELARAPAGITEREDEPVRTLTNCDVTQNVDCGGQREIFIDL